MAIYKDQFYVIDAYSPPAAGTSLSFVRYKMNDVNNSNSFTNGSVDTINGSAITQAYPGDTIKVNVPGVGQVTYKGTTFYLANGQVIFTPTDGQVLKNGTFVSSTFVTTQGTTTVPQLGPACFARGTLIDAPGGPVPIETLEPGDLVRTLDHGPQVLRWIGTSTVDGTGALAPVHFPADAVGNDRPLLVSPQHRMLMAGARAELMFGQAEVLVPALHLVGWNGVRRQPVMDVCYLHLLFDRHEIVFSEGAPSESFHPGGKMLADNRALRQEIAAIFPDCAGLQPGADIPAARLVLSRHEARGLIA